MLNKQSLVAAVFVALSLGSQAQSLKHGAIEIAKPWARPTVAGQGAGGGYLTLTNAGAADRLLSASSGVASVVELHTMSMDGNVMRMRQVEAIDLPTGQTVALKPGGLHMMFMGLRAPLQEGSSIPVKLKFEKAGEVMVDFKVEQPKAAGSAHQH